MYHLRDWVRRDCGFHPGFWAAHPPLFLSLSFSPFLSISLCHSFSHCSLCGKPVDMSWAALQRGPCGEGLRPPDNSHVSERRDASHECSPSWGLDSRLATDPEAEDLVSCIQIPAPQHYDIINIYFIKPLHLGGNLLHSNRLINCLNIPPSPWYPGPFCLSHMILIVHLLTSISWWAWWKASQHDSQGVFKASKLAKTLHTFLSLTSFFS